MLLAAFRGDAGYDILLFLHIASFLVAFAPAAVNPLLEKHLRENGGPAAVQTWASFAHKYTTRIAMSGLVVLLVTGLAMVISFDGWEFSQAWISIAFVVWIALAGVVSGMIGKAERLMAAGDDAGRELMAKAGPIAIGLLVVALWAMIFKPGV